jgi:hypothetical protein
LLLIEQLV